MIWTIVEIIVGVFLLVSFFYEFYVGYQAEVWGRVYVSLKKLNSTMEEYTPEGWKRTVKIYVISLVSGVLSAIGLVCLGFVANDYHHVATSFGIILLSISVFVLSRFFWSQRRSKEFSLRAKEEVRRYFLSRKKKVV